MHAEYDPTALTLMRAIKAGVDPKGIMNPGTLLPPPGKLPTPTKTATISTQNVDEWVVRPASLEEPAERDPRLRSVVEGGEGLFGWVWGEVKGWGDGVGKVVRGVVGGEESGGKGVEKVEKGKKAVDGWTERGDGA
jgi:FAD linked oxidases, C-terminal domain